MALASAAGAAVAEPKLIPLAMAYLVGLVCHLRCRPDDVASVTTNEMGIIFFGIAGALISAALLVPALAWAALAAAALVALEMRLAVQPAPALVEDPLQGRADGVLQRVAAEHHGQRGDRHHQGHEADDPRRAEAFG